MKSLSRLVALFVCLVSAHAAHAEVLSFSVVRAGGGSMQITVSKNENGNIAAVVKSCPSAQVELTEQEINDAKAILNDQATVASVVSFQPVMPTGTWLSLNVTYTVKDYQGNISTKVVNVSSPLVLVNGSVSPVIGKIETQARAAVAASCAR